MVGRKLWLAMVEFSDTMVVEIVVGSAMTVGEVCVEGYAYFGTGRVRVYRWIRDPSKIRICR